MKLNEPQKKMTEVEHHPNKTKFNKEKYVRIF